MEKKHQSYNYKVEIGNIVSLENLSLEKKPENNVDTSENAEKIALDNFFMEISYDPENYKQAKLEIELFLKCLNENNLELNKIQTNEDVVRLILVLSDFLFTDYESKLKASTKQHFHTHIKRFLQIYFNANM